MEEDTFLTFFPNHKNDYLSFLLVLGFQNGDLAIYDPINQKILC
jgi:hypothetical protein